MSIKRITAVAVFSGLVIVVGAALFVLSRTTVPASELMHQPAFMSLVLLLFLAIAGLMALGAVFYHSHATSCQNKSCSFHPRHKRQEELFDFASITSPIQFASESSSADANLAFIMSSTVAASEPGSQALGQSVPADDAGSIGSAEDSFDYELYRYLNADLDAVTEAALDKMTQRLLDRGIKLGGRTQPEKPQLIQRADASTTAPGAVPTDLAAAQRLVTQALSALTQYVPTSSVPLSAIQTSLAPARIAPAPAATAALAVQAATAPAPTAQVAHIPAAAIHRPAPKAPAPAAILAYAPATQATAILAAPTSAASDLAASSTAPQTEGINPWLLWDVSMIDEPIEKPSMEFTDDMVPKVLELLNQQQHLSQQQHDLNQQLINRLWGKDSQDKEKSGQSAAIEWLLEEQGQRGRHFKPADAAAAVARGDRGVLNSGIDRLSDYMQLLIKRSEPVAEDGYRQVS